MHDPAAAPVDGVPNPVVLVLSNLPARDVAEQIAKTLVDEQLAACVNIPGACRSIYRWQGVLQAAEETPVLIKTTADRYEALQARLNELHPYDVPEIVAWRTDAALPAFASWVVEQTPAKSPGGQPAALASQRPASSVPTSSAVCAVQLWRRSSPIIADQRGRARRARAARRYDVGPARAVRSSGNALPGTRPADPARAPSSKPARPRSRAASGCRG